MKKIILAASALISAASLTPAAQAADIAPAAYDWSGFYFGLNAGAAWNNTDIDNDIDYSGPGSVPDGVTMWEAACPATMPFSPAAP